MYEYIIIPINIYASGPKAADSLASRHKVGVWFTWSPATARKNDLQPAAIAIESYLAARLDDL